MEFLRTAVAAVALYAVGMALTPEKEGIKKACSTAFSLLLILVLLPRGGLGELSFSLFLPEEEVVGEEVYAEKLKEMTEKSVEEELCQRFSVKEGNLSVASDFSYRNGRVTVTHLTVTLKGTGVLADAPGLLRHVEENYGMECEVIIGESENAFGRYEG